MGAIIKTVNPVLIDARRGISEVLYFEIVAEQRADKAIFKGQVGLYSYLVEIQIMRDGVLVPAYREYPNLKPIQATYKLSTWFSLFGSMTPEQIEASKHSLMIQEFSYNSSGYWGVTASGYEEYNG